MTLNELLVEWSYRTKKGYPDLGNPSDILILEEILESLDLPLEEIIPNLKEGTKAANTRKAIDIILKSKYAKEHGFKKMSNTYRIGNLDGIDKDRFLEILIDLFNNPKIIIHDPGSGPNTSSKYNMFEFELEGEGLVQIYLAGGVNKGEKYEQDILEKIQTSFGNSIDNVQFDDIKKLFQTIGLDPTKFSPEDAAFMGASDTKRQLSFNGPTDLGSKVADIVIKTTPPTYLSIKDKKGSGIYNGGNVTFIRMEGEKAIFDQSKYNDKPLFREIFEACGIDPQRIADGINSYLTKKGERSEWQSSTSIDLGKIKNLLASSFGYGYWYVREKAKNNIFVHYINDEQGAYDMVGELQPNAVKIKYPGTTSKNMEIVIQTNSKVFTQEEGRTPLAYQIVMRNASGKILPMRLNIRTNK